MRARFRTSCRYQELAVALVLLVHPAADWKIKLSEYLQNFDTQFSVIDLGSATGDLQSLEYFSAEKTLSYKMFNTGFYELHIGRQALRITNIGSRTCVPFSDRKLEKEGGSEKVGRSRGFESKLETLGTLLQIAYGSPRKLWGVLTLFWSSSRMWPPGSHGCPLA